MREEAPRARCRRSFAPPPVAARCTALAPQPKPELPNPAALQQQEHFAAAPREFHAAQPAAPAAPPLPPRAISEILEPHAARAAHRDRAGIAAGSSARAGHPAGRRACLRRRSGSPLPKARSAKSPPAPKEPVSSSSFIAAARRAAQAAAAAPPPTRRRDVGSEGRAKDKGGDKAKAGDKADDKDPSNITSKIRSLLVGASVVVIVLGTFKMAMTLLDTGSAPQMPPMENSERAGRPAQAPRGEQRQARDAARPPRPR